MTTGLFAIKKLYLRDGCAVMNLVSGALVSRFVARRHEAGHGTRLVQIRRRRDHYNRPTPFPNALDSASRRARRESILRLEDSPAISRSFARTALRNCFPSCAKFIQKLFIFR